MLPSPEPEGFWGQPGAPLPRFKQGLPGPSGRGHRTAAGCLVPAVLTMATRWQTWATRDSQTVHPRRTRDQEPHFLPGALVSRWLWGGAARAATAVEAQAVCADLS